METLVLDGKTYVKASKAARELGYTSDYVGQLCRSGKVSAHLVGRTWYVDQTELGTHRVEKKRNARIKAREQVRKAVEERQKALQDNAPTSVRTAKRHITYEDDAADLMPVVKKIEVQTDVGKKKQKRPEPIDDEPDYTVLNEGNKVVMSGTIVVTDAVEDAALDEDTVFLQARLEKKKKISEKTKERAIKSPVEEISEAVNVHVDGDEETTKEAVEVNEKTGFLSKLEEREAVLPNDTAFQAHAQEQDAITGAESVPFVDTSAYKEDHTAAYSRLSSSGAKSGWVISFLTILVAFALSALALMVEGIWKFESNQLEMKTEYSVNADALKDKIRSKM